MNETLLFRLGARVAGAVSGATGFGFARVATGLWLFSRLDTERCRRLVPGLLAVCGTILVRRA